MPLHILNNFNFIIMKKFESLGKSLSKNEMKKISGGVLPVSTCNCNSTDDCKDKKVCANSCNGKPGDAKQGHCDAAM